MTQFLVPARSPVSFARKLQGCLREHPCEVLLSLERVFACDIYRAGDGVHAAWLERRERFQPAWKRLFRWVNSKHRQLLELERALFTGGARRVIANSKMVKNEIVARYGYPAEQIAVVYNGVPASAVDSLTRTEVRRELGLGSNDYVALFVGSGWERKGLRFAWDAAWDVEGLRLLIAGNDRITFKPHIRPGSGPHPYKAVPQRFLGPREDVPRLLAAADVFVLPTIYDPFSNACLEALAAGLPVITTKGNGFAEIMEQGVHGTVLEDPSDRRALVSALLEWQDANRRQSTQGARLGRAMEFTMDRNLRETVAVIERLEGEGRDDSARKVAR
jgi:UDP-glucose:(heptosyl)LPS alpha-1,3-glucosyltransferase